MAVAVGGMIRRVAREDPRVGSGDNKDRHKGPMKRGVRVEDDLWAAVREKASGDGKGLNAAVVEALEAYVGWTKESK